MEVYRTKELEKLYPQDNVSGVIYINGRTQEIYHIDKIIFTNSFDPIEHQRFVMAHELGHYLFDYLCSSRYVDNEDFFEETYKKGEYNHNILKEKIADRFAAELLMPTDLFIEQYRYASCVDLDNSEIFRTYFIKEYLARFFNVKRSSIEKRIQEVLLG